MRQVGQIFVRERKTYAVSQRIRPTLASLGLLGANRAEELRKAKAKCCSDLFELRGVGGLLTRLHTAKIGRGHFKQFREFSLTKATVFAPHLDPATDTNHGHYISYYETSRQVFLTMQ